jgi:hypothetical protein
VSGWRRSFFEEFTQVVSAGDAQFLVDVLETAFDAADRETQLAGNFFVGVAGGKEGRFPLGRGEAGAGLDGPKGGGGSPFASLRQGGGPALAGRAAAGVSGLPPGGVGGRFGREQVGTHRFEGNRGVVESDRITTGQGLGVGEPSGGELPFDQPS